MTSQVTLNSMITSSLRYNQATETFHQWRDADDVIYGLNFVSREDADTFAQSMLHALEAIGGMPLLTCTCTIFIQCINAMGLP